ncbi:hypothetical protein BO86DRAFT_99959 [Aspergillus japonicus CBS 114.51]|uniref:Uncharacterized protein n=1 Tax=Aspergillus japonicus CBS 114.51 TaxID=1448312 RepID=A0A8T8X050_ASPJA|nr:hypothetical protein BO86DRAFT_99959 [Aspergillus japonicus CBS 114.51]RAH81294.1 hypothetical protein BO86DRAFT_99959 [Aspergillus japonicus CBS 114.51]
MEHGACSSVSSMKGPSLWVTASTGVLAPAVTALNIISLESSMIIRIDLRDESRTWTSAQETAKSREFLTCRIVGHRVSPQKGRLPR